MEVEVSFKSVGELGSGRGILPHAPAGSAGPMPAPSRWDSLRTFFGKFLGLITLAFASAGCGSLLFPDRAEHVRVALDGSASGVIHVITSDDFLLGSGGAGPGSEVRFLRADTASVTLPFDKSYDLPPAHRFAVRVSTPPGDSAEVRMRVWVDSDRVHEDRMTIVDNFMQYFTVRN